MMCKMSGRREGRRRGRVRGRDGRDGARQMSAAHSSDARSSHPTRRDRRRRGDRRRSRSSARTARSATAASSRRARRSSATSRSAANVKVGVGTVLGGDPQDLKYKGEPTTVEIGDGTTIREYTTINRGTTQSFKTTVGKNCFLMSYVHLAHDCHVGDGVIISNGDAARRARDDRREGDLCAASSRCTSSRRSGGTASSADARAWRRTFRRT